MNREKGLWQKLLGKLLKKVELLQSISWSYVFTFHLLTFIFFDIFWFNYSKKIRKIPRNDYEAQIRLQISVRFICLLLNMFQCICSCRELDGLHDKICDTMLAIVEASSKLWIELSLPKNLMKLCNLHTAHRTQRVKENILNSKTYF